MIGGYQSFLAFWMGGARGGTFIPPEPVPPVAAHGAGMEQYRQHMKQQALALDDEEMLLIISELVGAIE